MVGTWGLEPQTSTVSILGTMMERMGTSEYKLHSYNDLRRLYAVIAWIEQYSISLTCMD